MFINMCNTMVCYFLIKDMRHVICLTTKNKIPLYCVQYYSLKHWIHRNDIFGVFTNMCNIMVQSAGVKVRHQKVWGKYETPQDIYKN